MGVTIHFEGRLRADRTETFLNAAFQSARSLDWHTEMINEPEGHLKHVINDQDRDYHGHVRGLVARPGSRCEPIFLAFGSDLFVQDFVKTQFAGSSTHQRVCQYLKELQVHFEALDVFDEGEFWETGDAGLLEKHLAASERAIEDAAQERPGSRIGVRLPSGRIVDVLS